MYEIIDNDGVIYSGDDYDELLKIFYFMTKDSDFLVTNDYCKNWREAKKEIKKHFTTWNGDLKLIQVLNIDR